MEADRGGCGLQVQIRCQKVLLAVGLLGRLLDIKKFNCKSSFTLRLCVNVCVCVCRNKAS